MKKILFFSALVAMLLGTASCSSDIEPAMGGEVPVSFSVNLGDGIDSRTISDGLGADVLKFAVFENGTEITALAQNNVPVSNKQATVTTHLVKGHTYTFVFWAQNSACTAYNTSNMKAITVNYTTVNCNDETRDAFYKAMPDYTVTEAFTENVTLKRPFAQINFLADDAAGVVGVNNYKSKVTVTGVPTTLNTLDGTVGETTTDVTFDYATIVAATEELEGYTDYRWVAMNYILAAPAKEMKNEVVLTVNDGSQDVNTVTVTSCPVQRNYRTNIFGSLFTVEGKFNINIDPIYDGEFILPEKVWDGVTRTAPALENGVYTVTNEDEMAYVFQNLETLCQAQTVNITNNLNMGNHPFNGITTLNGYNGTFKNLAINGNGKTIKGLVEPLIGSTWTGGTLAFNDITIDESAIETSDNTIGYGAFVGNISCNKLTTFTNCHLTNSTVKGGKWTGGMYGYGAGYDNQNNGPVFSEIEITGCSTENCTIEAKGSVGAVCGHATGDNWTLVTITNFTATGNTITSTDDSNKKAGSLIGTVGVGGKTESAGKRGGTYVNNYTVSSNTVTSNGITIDRIYGRIGSGGLFVVDGVEMPEVQ